MHNGEDDFVASQWFITLLYPCGIPNTNKFAIKPLFSNNILDVSQKN